MYLSIPFLVFFAFLKANALLLENINQVENYVTRKELNQEIQALKAVIAELNATVTKERTWSNVAFVAELSRSIVDPSSNFHIIFDHVIINAGNGYKSTHGIFVAPYPGFYHFSVEITAPPQSSNHGMHIRIMKKTQPVAITFLDSNTHQFLRRTGSIILQLDTGDDVWCQTDLIIGSNTIYGGNTYSMFSGFIIQPML